MTPSTLSRLLELADQCPAGQRLHIDPATIKGLVEEHQRFSAALTLIAAQKGMTLIAPSMGQDADHGHQVGANKAFDEMAFIATAALGDQP